VRILYVVTSAGFGGASMHVLQLMRYFSAHGFEIGLVSAPEPKLLGEAEKLGVKLFVNPYFVRRFHVFNDVRAFIPVRKAIKEFSPDIIHAHSTKAGLIARFWSAVLNVKPIIFTAHGWVFTEGREYWKRFLLAQLEKLAGYVTDKIICVSEFDKKLALKFKVADENKLVVIHNGIDPTEFLCISRDYRKSSDKVIVTFVGRLAPPKDLFLLIDAVKLVPEVKLQIVGDGELRRKVERYILKNSLNERVILLGERFDIPNILAESDIFVLPSKWEGLPLTIIEAMMSGLPVVATRVGGVPELVEDGVNGYLVPPGDVNAFADAIRKLACDVRLREIMGKAGQKKAIENFTLDKMLSRVAQVYEEVLSKRKKLYQSVKNG